MKVTPFNEIDEFEGSIQAQVNYSLNNNFYNDIVSGAKLVDEHHNEEKKDLEVGGDNNENTASPLSDKENDSPCFGDAV